MKAPKFVQITSCPVTVASHLLEDVKNPNVNGVVNVLGAVLYALDHTGQIWRKMPYPTHSEGVTPSEWEKV